MHELPALPLQSGIRLKVLGLPSVTSKFELLLGDAELLRCSKEAHEEVRVT